MKVKRAQNRRSSFSLISEMRKNLTNLTNNTSLSLSNYLWKLLYDNLGSHFFPTCCSMLQMVNQLVAMLRDVPSSHLCGGLQRLIKRHGALPGRDRQRVQ